MCTTSNPWEAGEHEPRMGSGKGCGPTRESTAQGQHVGLPANSTTAVSAMTALTRHQVTFGVKFPSKESLSRQP